MKSIFRIISGLFFALIFVIFSSCENFATSSENFKKQMTEEVKTSNALRVDVEIWPLDPDHGRVSSTEISELLVGDSFKTPVKFSLNSDYYHFSNWVAYKNFNTTKKQGDLLGTDVITFENPTLEETYVTLKKKEKDCSKIWLVPVCTEHPSVFFMDQELPDDVTFSPSGSYQLIKNKSLNVVLKYPESYGFKNIQFYSGNTLKSNLVPVLERNQVEENSESDFILKTETAPADNDPVALKAKAVIYNLEQVSEGTGKYSFTMVLPDNLEENLYVVPSVFKHPVVNFVDLENASVKPSGKTVLVENKDYENLSIVTDNNYGFIDWEAYLTDSEGRTNLSVYRDSDKFWNSIGDYVYVTKDKSITDESGKLKSYASFEKAVAVIYNNNPETNESGSAKGQTKVTPVIRILKPLPESSVLNLSPVLFEHPVLKFVNPKTEFTASSKAAGKSTITPSGSVKEITNIPFEVKADCDDAYAFRRWIVLDQDGNEVPENQIPELFKIEAGETNETLSVATCRVTSLTNVSGYSISAEVVERPKVKNTNPSNDSIGVIRTYPVNIYLNKSLASEYAEHIDDYITITCLDNPAEDVTDINSGKPYFYPAVIDSNNKHILFQTKGGIDPNKWMKSRSFVTVIISGEIKDVDGIPFGNDYEFSFTLGSKGDTEGPAITPSLLYATKYDYENGEDFVKYSAGTCSQFENYSTFENFRVGNEKNYPVKVSDEIENFQFKAIIDADDSDTGGAGVDRIFITERLVYVGPGNFVKNIAGNEVYVPEPGLRLFDNNGQFIGGNLYSKSDFENKIILNTDILTREASGFAFGFDFAEHLQVDGVHQFIYSATDVLGHESDEPVSFFVVRDTKAPGVNDLSSTYTYSYSAGPGEYYEEMQKIYLSRTDGKHSINFNFDQVSDWGTNENDFPKTVSENIWYRLSQNQVSENFNFTTEPWKKTSVSSDVEIKVTEEIVSNYFWVQLRDDLGNISEAVRLTNSFNYPLDVSVDSKLPSFKEITADTTDDTNKCAVGKTSVYSEGTAKVNVAVSDEGSGVKKWTITKPDSTVLENTAASGSVTMDSTGNYIFVITDNVGNESFPVSIEHKIDTDAPVFAQTYGNAGDKFFSVKDKVKGSEGYVFNEDGEVSVKFRVQDSVSGLGKITVSGIEPDSLTVNNVTREISDKILLDSTSEFFEENTSVEFELTGKLTDFAQKLESFEPGSRISFEFTVSVEDLLGHKTEKSESFIYTDAVPTLGLVSVKDVDSGFENFVNGTGNVELTFSVLEKGMGIKAGSFTIDGFETISSIESNGTSFTFNKITDCSYTVSGIEGIYSEPKTFTVTGTIPSDLPDGKQYLFNVYCQETVGSDSYQLACPVTVDRVPPQILDLKAIKDGSLNSFREEAFYVNKNGDVTVQFILDNIKSGIKNVSVSGLKTSGFVSYSADYVKLNSGSLSLDDLKISSDLNKLAFDSSLNKILFMLSGTKDSTPVTVSVTNNLGKSSSSQLSLTQDSQDPSIQINSVNGIFDDGSKIYYTTDKKVEFKITVQDQDTLSGLNYLAVYKSVLKLSPEENDPYYDENNFYYFDLRGKTSPYTLDIKGEYLKNSGDYSSVFNLTDKAGNTKSLARTFVQDETGPAVSFVKAYDTTYNFEDWTDGDFAMVYNVKDPSGFQPLNFSLYGTVGLTGYEIKDNKSSNTSGLKNKTSFYGPEAAEYYYDADIILYLTRTPGTSSIGFSTGLKAKDRYGNISFNNDNLSGYCKGIINIDSKNNAPITSNIKVYDRTYNKENTSNGDLKVSGTLSTKDVALIKNISILDSENTVLVDNITVNEESLSQNVSASFNLSSADSNGNYNFIIKVETKTGRIELLPFTCKQDKTAPTIKNKCSSSSGTKTSSLEPSVDKCVLPKNGTDIVIDCLDSGPGIQKVEYYFAKSDSLGKITGVTGETYTFNGTLDEETGLKICKITKADILMPLINEMGNKTFNTGSTKYIFLVFTAYDCVGNSKKYACYILVSSVS